ncbi:MAG: speB [Devosia sp.]|nr:speB [Devosia sp.]
MTTPVSLQGIPYDANSSAWRGQAAGPGAIRQALLAPSANAWSELGVDFANAPDFHDAGDLLIGDWPPLEANLAIRAATEGLIDRGHLVLSLGGDHSIAHPLIAAHATRYPGLAVLHIDAHGDLYDDYEGNPFSHASPFARLLEAGVITRRVQVGIRTLNAHQREQVKRFGVECYEMHAHEALPQLAFDGPFYISLDLDAMDPAHCPGVSHHEPGGLTVREVIRLVHRTKGELVGADIVELNPSRDLNDTTAMVAARFVKEIGARLLTGVVVG